MHGELTIHHLAEGDDPNSEKFAFIRFHNPVTVQWSLREDPHGNTPDPAKTGKAPLHIEVDNIPFQRTLEIGAAHPAGCLENPSREGIERSILRMLAFEFAHAFNHYQGDPNYGLLHWALYGMFRHETDILEPEEEPA